MDFQPYIVSNSKETKYNTIQKAINSAKSNGGGLVYLQPGIYREDLKLFDGVDLCGAIGIADTQTCIIRGKHSPPKNGTVTVKNVCLESSESIFSSNEKGDAEIHIISCFIKVKCGYIFDLPNWSSKGKIVGFDLGDSGSIDNGIINNSNGTAVRFIAATFGGGTKYPMVLSGETNFYTVECKAPIVFKKNSVGLLVSGCTFWETIMVEDRSTLKIINANFITKNSPSIVYNSSEDSFLTETSIDSENKSVIKGNGKGTLKITGVSFVNKTNIDKKLKKTSGDLVSGNFISQEPGKGLQIAEGTNAKLGTIKLKEGMAFVKNSNVTSNSRIFLTHQSYSSLSGFIAIESLRPGEGFNIRSSISSDEGIVAWMIVESYES